MYHALKYHEPSTYTWDKFKFSYRTFKEAFLDKNVIRITLNGNLVHGFELVEEKSCK